MDDICGSEEICEGEVTQISDIRNVKRNEEIMKDILEDSNQTYENILNKEEFKVYFENLNFVTHESDDNADGEDSLQKKKILSIPIEACMKSVSNNSVKVITTSEDRTEDDGLLNSETVAHLSDIQNQEEVLNEAIDKALNNHLDFEEEDFNYESGLSNDGDSDCKEASVQAAFDQFLISNASCPICRLQKIELKNDLTALCLEYPPYKKRKINKLDSVSGSYSEVGFTEITEDSSEEGEMEELRRKKVSLEDQIVPKYPSQTVIAKDQNADTSSRSIRIGLSRYAKLRPLHKVSKLQAGDATENDA